MKFPVIFKDHPSKQFAEAIKTAKENYKNLPEKDKKFTHFCPYCGAPLEATERLEPLETLDEHVFCSDVTKKTVYKCSANCEDSQYTMWNYDGESYMDIPKNISEKEREEAYNKRSEINKRVFGSSVNYCGEALGSWWCKADCSSSAPGKKTEYRLQFFKNQKYVPVIRKKYVYNEFAEPEGFTLSLEYHVKEDNGRFYIIKQSLTSKILITIKSTKHDYLFWKENPSDRRLKKLYGIYGLMKTTDDYKGFDKLWYKYVVPFIFGTIMGIKLPDDKNK